MIFQSTHNSVVNRLQIPAGLQVGSHEVKGQGAKHSTNDNTENSNGLQIPAGLQVGSHEAKEQEVLLEEISDRVSTGKTIHRRHSKTYSKIMTVNWVETWYSKIMTILKLLPKSTEFLPKLASMGDRESWAEFLYIFPKTVN